MAEPQGQFDMEVVNVPVIPLKVTPRSSFGSKPSSHVENSESFTSYSSKAPTNSPSEDSLHLTVPPVTPSDAFAFNNELSQINRPFPKLADFKLPYIREVGVKASIDILSKHFSCLDYKYNAVQFWFLDVITDCLWKVQDEFQFPERYQKIIVEWILHVFDLIRDPQRNLSRKEFFQIFNEALIIADEKVQAGCEMLPTPDDLFTMVQDGSVEEEEKISFGSTSGQCSSVSLTEGGESYVALGIDESVEVFKMPKVPKKCYKFDVSTNTTASEDLSTESLCGCEELVEFYQPDRNVPERFQSLLSFSSSTTSDEGDELSIFTNPKFLWRRSSLPPDDVKKVCDGDKQTDLEELISMHSKEIRPEDDIINEWKDYVDDRKELIYDTEMKILINSCALFAIKQFVYDYFHEGFQYTIIKSALINTFFSITQNVNQEWRIPKILKEELKKPKMKKEKKMKEKKKKPQKAKQKKKPKKKKKKGSKKGKKPKKAKPKKPTKEEKAELKRLQLEQERLEEERRLAEENRRMLFPLNDAANDEFFQSIFENWVKPKEKKQKGKGKKKGKQKK
ncbi:hypothetical protein Zmor_026688 [Zophobas morio]|uniref:Uncharacterized protein n=1 Tax=Zophobas morio TaxID=2755281 RepID=A0AA38HUU6_9CUCU|nr:hypothetical protein Zmor_026688 [Zophobas morio]